MVILTMKKIIAVFIITLLCISCGRKYELYKAIDKKDIPKIKELIEKGAPINTMSQKGNTALILATELGDIDFVKYLLEKGADVNQQGAIGMTALMAACSYGYIEIVILLIDKGAYVDIKDRSGDTALWYAVTKKGNFTIVKLIINQLKKYNLINNSIVTSAIFTAVAENDPDVVELLLQNGADVNYKTESGWSLLAWAQQHKYDKVAEILIKYGAEE